MCIRDSVKEAHYTRSDRKLFALAFPNNAGGYELRSARFKGTHGAKGITLIESPEHPNATLSIFEGFMDMLSAVELGLLPKEGSCVLVLNSAAMRERAAEFTRERTFQDIHLYLDNDEAGKQLVVYFREQFPETHIEDRSALYATNKDLNEYLQTQMLERTR